MNQTNTISDTIQQRKTEKIFSDDVILHNFSNTLINTLLQDALAAPVHYTADRSHFTDKARADIRLPWRVYSLDKDACLWLRDQLICHGDVTKVPKMLAAASTLLIFTWLPDPDQQQDSKSSNTPYVGTLRNMEHIAAASAAIQNVLLSATAKDIPNYWSSGGMLRSDQVFKWLNIPLTDILLGAIFLFPPQNKLSDAESKAISLAPGKLRDKKGEIKDILTNVNIF